MDTLNLDDPNNNNVDHEIDDNNPVDLNHPLYLHPSNTTGTILVSVQLTCPENLHVYFSYCQE